MLSGGLIDRPLLSGGLQESSASSRLTSHKDRTLELQRKCLRLLCSSDRCDRAPMEFALQREMRYNSRATSVPILLHMRYVEIEGRAYATNDPQIYDPHGQSQESNGLPSSLLDDDGWVLPLRPPMYRRYGTRANVLLSNDLMAEARQMPVILKLMHVELSDIKGEPPMYETDLSQVEETYKVVHDPQCGSEAERAKRQDCQMFVGPHKLYGAESSAGRITINLDDLWEDILTVLKVVYNNVYMGDTALKKAIEEYSRYTSRNSSTTSGGHARASISSHV